MKNRIKARIAPLFGIIVLAIIGLSMIGCEDETQIVDYDYSRAPQVSAVTVAKTTNKQFYIVSWDAVAGEDIYYTLFFKQDGKESASQLSGHQNTYKYDPDTGAAISNDNRDKWSILINSLNVAAGSYCYGVRTGKNDGKASEIYSDIKWSDAFAVTALPAITPTLTITTDEAYVIGTFAGNKDASSSDYTVAFYEDNIEGYFYAYLQNTFRYDPDNGDAITNTTDAEKANWAARVAISNFEPGKTYFVTLVNKYTLGDDVGIVQSLPTKSNTITIPAP